MLYSSFFFFSVFCFFQAEDGIRDLVRSRGLGDVYKRQPLQTTVTMALLFYGILAMRRLAETHLLLRIHFTLILTQAITSQHW